MTARVLDPAEWPRLRGTELGGVWAQLPASAQVLAVEDDAGALVGCWALFPCWHAEGVWIAPAHRGKGAVARRLWRLLATVGRAEGLLSVITGATTPEVAAILLRAGAVRVPYTEYVLPLPMARLDLETDEKEWGGYASSRSGAVDCERGRGRRVADRRE